MSNNIPPSTPTLFFPQTFGSHKGKTFEAMRRDHPDYIAWCQKQESPKSAMKALIDFCDGKNNTDYTSRAPTAVRAPTSSSAPHFTAALGGPSSPTRRMSSHHQPDVIDLTAEPDCPPALGPQLPDIDLTISDYSPPRVVAPLPYLQPGIDLTLSDYEKFQR